MTADIIERNKITQDKLKQLYYRKTDNLEKVVISLETHSVTHQMRKD